MALSLAACGSSDDSDDSGSDSSSDTKCFNYTGKFVYDYFGRQFSW